MTEAKLADCNRIGGLEDICAYADVAIGVYGSLDDPSLSHVPDDVVRQSVRRSTW